MNTPDELPEDNSATAILARDANTPGQPNKGLFYSAGDLLRKGWQSVPSQVGRAATNATFNAGPLVGGAAAGVAGAGLGYGIGKILDWRSDDEEDEGNWRGRLGAILGGVAGVGAGAYLGMKRDGGLVKSNSKRASSDAMEIHSALMADSSISSSERSTLLQSVAQLPQSDIQLLAKLVRTVAGAGVGALIAKFLFKSGAGGMLLGGLLGGFAGASTLAGPGRASNTDLYGNPYRL